MTNDSADRDPEIRRRAAWLLGMLALVAALIVLVFVVFFNGNDGGGDDSDLAGPTTTPTQSSGTDSSTRSATDSSSSSPTDTATSGSSTSSGTPSDTASGSAGPGQKVSCPSEDTCTFDSDIGNAVAAINDYREKNDKPKIPGIVSAAATKCAKSNGGDCSGSWASTYLNPTDGRADGAKAVEKIKSLGKLLSDMESIEIGWAYDPGSKQLYFAVVRQT